MRNGGSAGDLWCTSKGPREELAWRCYLRACRVRAADLATAANARTGLARLLAYPDLINQTKVNSKKQFMESQDFQAAVTEAVIDNQEAHNTMADYFFSDGPGISAVIMALADAFYEAAIDQRTDV